jgi:hypothetical protein
MRDFLTDSDRKIEEELENADVDDNGDPIIREASVDFKPVGNPFRTIIEMPLDAPVKALIKEAIAEDADMSKMVERLRANTVALAERLQLRFEAGKPEQPVETEKRVPNTLTRKQFMELVRVLNKGLDEHLYGKYGMEVLVYTEKLAEEIEAFMQKEGLL